MSSSVVAFAFNWNVSLQQKDQITLAGNIHSDAKIFSIDFMLNPPSKTIAYRMKTFIDKGTVMNVEQCWSDGSKLEDFELGQIYRIGKGK